MSAPATNIDLLPLLDTIETLRSASADGGLAVVEHSLRAGEMSPLHVHDQDEAVHVVEGSVVIHLEGEAVHLRAGESLVAPAGVPHTVAGTAARSRLRGMTFTRSAARYEDFLRAVARPQDGMRGFGAAAWATEEDEATVTAIASRAGIVVLGAPGDIPARVKAA